MPFAPAQLAEVVPASSASGALSLLWLLLALPLVGTAVLLLGGRRTNAWGHLLATATSALTFLIALVSVFALAGREDAQRTVVQQLWSYIPVSGFRVDAALQYDQLSAVFVLLITGVGTLVHVYSIGYLEHDPRRRVFFAYLNLFLASMLLLVLGSNFLVLYIGWEMVGLSSYLLIAFWQYRPSAATAAKKAFVANRVGDVGLSIAIMIMFATFGRTDFASVFSAAGGASTGTVTAICLLLVLAGCGKSAQFPLHVWLPDAMEGPTPASALIHAATMVTAGVYLIARSAVLFDLSPSARLVAGIVGVTTILIGCVIGAAQDDIKKVLAYSTISQIGYMFLGVSIGPEGYVLGILHLLTHGFFKAGLFMGAGSVMHAMGDQVDMRRFGGLARVLPITFVTFFLGYLAIIGFPFLSGYYSKEKIVEAAFDKGGTSGYVLGGCALLGVALTAYYMTRVVVMTFFGPRRWTESVHPHEAPVSMTAPMIVLAVGSVGAGFLLTRGEALQNWLAPVTGYEQAETHPIAPILLTLLSLGGALAGAALAVTQYSRRPVPHTAPAAGVLVTAARNKLYVDATYEALLMRPGQYLTRALVYLDGKGIDGAVNGLSAAVGGSSGRLRRLQTGFVRSYALSMFGGAAALVGLLLLVRLG